jgi:hypothetical protein
MKFWISNSEELIVWDIWILILFSIPGVAFRVFHP